MASWPTPGEMKTGYVKLRESDETLLQRYINRAILRVKSRLRKAYDVTVFIDPVVPPALREIVSMLAYGYYTGIRVHSGAKKKAGDESADKTIEDAMKWLEEIAGDEGVLFEDEQGTIEISRVDGSNTTSYNRTEGTIFTMGGPETWRIRPSRYGAYSNNPRNVDPDD